MPASLRVVPQIHLERIIQILITGVPRGWVATWLIIITIPSSTLLQLSPLALNLSDAWSNFHDVFQETVSLVFHSRVLKNYGIMTRAGLPVILPFQVPAGLYHTLLLSPAPRRIPFLGPSIKDNCTVVKTTVLIMKVVGLLTEKQTIKSSSLPITILTRIYISEVQLLKILIALCLTPLLANGVNRHFGFLQVAFKTQILKILSVSQSKILEFYSSGDSG